MVGVLGSASLGVNSQRYNDAVNTFSAIVQQEFTNVTNVVNTKSVQNMCGSGTDVEQQRGVSDCIIMGRLMTIDDKGDIVKSNLVGRVPGVPVSASATEIEVIRSYDPLIDTASQETERMSWDTKIEKASAPDGSFVSMLFVRSPRSGNVYSYVVHSNQVVSNKTQLDELIVSLVGQASNPQNSRDQYICIDRAGWVVTPTRVIKIAPYASGPSGVSIADAAGDVCD